MYSLSFPIRNNLLGLIGSGLSLLVTFNKRRMLGGKGGLLGWGYCGFSQRDGVIRRARAKANPLRRSIRL